MRKKIAVAVALLFVFLVGIGIGGTSSPEPAKAKVETHTRTVTKRVVPDSCVVALQGWKSISLRQNEAGSAYLDAAKYGVAGDVNDAISAVRKGNAKVKSATADLKSTVKPAHDACLAAAQS